MKKLYSYIVGAMVMALPVSLMAVAALPSVTGEAEEETTAKTDTAIISFADSTYAMSTSKTTAGDITEARTFQIGEGTLTVNPNASGTANRIWAYNSKPQLRVYGGTMKFDAPAGRAITNIIFSTSKTWTEPTYSPASSDSTAKAWTGNASSVEVTVSKQCQINTITVVYDDANSETVTPAVKVITFETVADIAAFNTLPKDSAVRLTLTNAYVTKVNNKNIYVQDASAAVVFYSTNLDLEEGQVLNGTIIGTASPYNGTPEFVANDSTNLDSVTVTEGVATPKDVTVADVTTDVLSQLVKLGKTQLVTDADGAHYAVQGEDTIQVYDQFKVLDSDYEWPESAQSITAIVGSFKGKLQLMPVSADAIEVPVLEAGDYYLYNIGTSMWLCAGNSWGTQASLDDYGLDFTVAQLEDGTYTLDSRVKNSNTQHYLGSNAYVDANAYGWTVSETTSTSTALKVLTLSTADGKYLAYSGDGTVVGTTDDGTTDNAKWLAVSKTERLGTIKAAMATASKENPVDVTLLFQGMNFGRNDQRNSAWQGSYGLGGDNANQNAEKWNSSFDVYQTAEVPNGQYTVVYQGYYRDGGYAEAATARQAGTEALTAVAYANNVEKTVQSIFVAANALEGVGVSSELGSVPNSQSDASKYFTAGLYNDTITGVAVTGGTLKIGIKETTGKANNWACFDNFRVYCTSNQVDLTSFREAYEAALAAAQEAQKDTIVTGEELTALNAIVEQYDSIEEPSQDAYVEATEALTQATETLNTARTSYKALVDAKAAVKEYPYAAEQKVADLNATLEEIPTTAAVADSLTTALQLQERIVSESNVMAEIDTTATNMTDSIVNPTAADDIDAGVWTTTGGKINVKSNEPWTDADGNTTHRYFDSDNWSSSAWTTSLTQELKLTEGKYILSVISRASADMTSFKLFAKAGETELGSVEMSHTGASGALFNSGWDRSYVVFDVPADTTVTFGVEGATSTVHNWMSFSDFRLVQFTPAEEVDLDTTITVAPADSVWFAYVGQEKAVDVTFVHTGTSGTIKSFAVQLGYQNAEDENLVGELEPNSANSGDLAPAESNVVTVTWTPTAVGTYYLYYFNAEGEKVLSEKTIRVYETKEEMDNVIDGVNGVKADTKTSGNVYTVNGQLVRKNASTLMGLPKGIYIQGGKKIVVK